MTTELTYPDTVIPQHRFQFCPMCTHALTRSVIFDDGIPRIHCPSCGWIQFVSNAVGVNVIARAEEGIVVIEPPGEDGVALVAVGVEYGESPQEAALRELREEAGLTGRITREIGWYFASHTRFPGPVINFVFEVEITGGTPTGSDEGPARIIPFDQLPPISSKRTGSQRAMEMYRNFLSQT